MSGSKKDNAEICETPALILKMLERMWKESHPEATLTYPITSWKDDMESPLVRIISIFCDKH